MGGIGAVIHPAGNQAAEPFLLELLGETADAAGFADQLAYFIEERGVLVRLQRRVGGGNGRQVVGHDALSD